MMHDREFLQPLTLEWVRGIQKSDDGIRGTMATKNTKIHKNRPLPAIFFVIFVFFVAKNLDIQPLHL